MKCKFPRSKRFFAFFIAFSMLAVAVLVVRPVFATRIFEDGFETGDFSKWSPVVGNPSVTSGDAHHGTYKAVLTTGGQYAQARFTLVPINHCFMRAYVMFKSFPASGTETTILGVYDWGSSIYMSEVRVANVSGTAKWKLRYYSNGAHFSVTSEQQKPVLNTWFCVEVEGRSNSTTGTEARMYVNGNELTDISQTGKNNPYAITCGYIWANSAVARWYDCVVIDGSYIGPECTVTTNVVGSGSVDKAPNLSVYDWGTNVTLAANPTLGWSFDHWTGDAAGVVNPVTLNVTSDNNVTAIFTQNTYTLAASIIGNGIVNMNNTGPYYYGDVVELTAVPSIGWSFDSWSGDLSGSFNPTTILVDGDKTVTATFTQNVYTLTITSVGGGSVSLNNTGSYYYGDVVELNAVSTIGWTFDHWSGDISGITNPTIILIDGNKLATATFTQNVYTLTVTIVGDGLVSMNNSGPYHHGDIIELTAAPSIGWSFSNWSGAISGSTSPKTIIIDGNKAVTATFSQITYSLFISATPPSGGSVNLNNTGPYHHGDVVKLTAVPASGWSHQGWSGDLSSITNPSVIVMDGNKAVMATFSPPAVVGGYSIRVSARSIVRPAIAYAGLVCLFGTMFIALRRKRK